MRLPEAFYDHLKAYVGRPVIFGVRPEDMTARDAAAGDGSGNSLTARADVVETLGAETFVYLTCGAHSIVARMEAPERPLDRGAKPRGGPENAEDAYLRQGDVANHCVGNYSKREG